MKDPYIIADIEFLISTQNKVSLDFLKAIFKGYDLTKTSILIVNQTQPDMLLHSDFYNIRIVNSYEKGVAKSRNLALQNARGKIVVFTDDDVEYFQDTCQIIVDAYNSNNTPDAILFQAQKSNSELLKPYANNVQDPISTMSILNCGTIEITLKTENFDPSRFKFDERFGINAAFELGDEPVFIMDLKRDGKRVLFVNKSIVQHENITTILKNSAEKNYFILGAFYKRIFPKYHKIWIFIKVFFDLKQKKIKVNEVFNLLGCAKEGRNKFISTIAKNNSL